MGRVAVKSSNQTTLAGFAWADDIGYIDLDVRQ